MQRLDFDTANFYKDKIEKIKARGALFGAGFDGRTQFSDAPFLGIVVLLVKIKALPVALLYDFLNFQAGFKYRVFFPQPSVASKNKVRPEPDRWADDVPRGSATFGLDGFGWPSDQSKLFKLRGASRKYWFAAKLYPLGVQICPGAFQLT